MKNLGVGTRRYTFHYLVSVHLGKRGGAIFAAEYRVRCLAYRPKLAHEIANEAMTTTLRCVIDVLAVNASADMIGVKAKVASVRATKRVVRINRILHNDIRNVDIRLLSPR